MNRNPYKPGSPVSKNNFYGRKQIINEILNGDRDLLWVLSSRRIGKTSLLQQIDYSTTSEDNHHQQFVSAFLSLAGCKTFNSMAQPLRLAIGLKKQLFADFGIHYEKIKQLNILEMLETTLIKLSDHKKKLLLLFDEPESLLKIGESEPEMLEQLGGIFEQGKSNSLRVVIVGTNHLLKLPFELLESFGQPLYLSNMEEEETEALIKQTKVQNTEIEFLRYNGELIKKIINYTGSHPLLAQTLCFELFPNNDLDNVVNALIKRDTFGKRFEKIISYFSETERNILGHISNREPIELNKLKEKISTRYPIPASDFKYYLGNLSKLGFIKEKDNNIRTANFFLREWLERNKNRVLSEEYPGASKLKITDKDLLQSYKQLKINSPQVI